jgi:hypothetical protein
MKEFMERVNVRVDRLQLQAVEREAAVPAVRLVEKLWLSLEESVAYSGLAGADLIRLAREGKISARKSAGWRFRRASLEAFEG